MHSLRSRLFRNPTRHPPATAPNEVHLMTRNGYQAHTNRWALWLCLAFLLISHEMICLAKIPCQATAPFEGAQTRSDSQHTQDLPQTLHGQPSQHNRRPYDVGTLGRDTGYTNQTSSNLSRCIDVSIGVREPRDHRIQPRAYPEAEETPEDRSGGRDSRADHELFASSPRTAVVGGKDSRRRG